MDLLHSSALLNAYPSHRDDKKHAKQNNGDTPLVSGQNMTIHEKTYNLFKNTDFKKQRAGMSMTKNGREMGG